ncbi:FliI/YscN family ATPase [Pandoraea pulmonicola]|uniref:EscN/YscN/HrcN family type III secretion system ATPase n=1 Tax=Pandoraea pulmonicola TaxID=93221 RepID=A0AAJ4ZAY7_PANPU|nr:FliI/YscN family ATPase [Pandoraea pulmonicola]AJC23321.2 EscN/YscN/HrcN family type III secretion system ATPase [Pandoraea pulmonicola]SUA90060.1 Probable ATP synthase SpaL [Pandoraea pulmonicola]
MSRHLCSSWIRHSAQLSKLHGSVIHAPLRRTFIGERCDVVLDPHHPETRLCQAQTIGFSHQDAILSILGNTQGIPRDAWIVPSGRGASPQLDDDALGTAIDSEGRVIARLAPPRHRLGQSSTLNLDATPPALARRRSVSQVFETGVRAIDGLLTCGVGQRVGIFAGAGGGKTTLMSMLIAHAKADVYVVGLVGERGREASEFIAHGIPQDKRDQTILVCSTSDRPPAERRNAAHLATAIAERYRDSGLNVLLIVDSITRYARALRDIALSAGEPPARRGFPASVFDALPALLERPGVLDHGSITAFYTVLLEDEDLGDPIGEEVRSILDGHIYLSRKLAERGHFPAIDALKSTSRVMAQIVELQHRSAASELRGKLAKLSDLQLALDLGEYQPGKDSEVDALLEARPGIDAWLRQDIDDYAAFDSTIEGLHVLTR